MLSIDALLYKSGDNIVGLDILCHSNRVFLNSTITFIFYPKGIERSFVEIFL